MIERLSAALEDRYRIERELGEGGMATVYLAEDVRHDRKVAVKVLRPELAAVVGAERFLAEIRTTAALQHPHILPLHDSGEADGFLFYVMPYVEGESLRDRLDRERQLPVEEAVELARKVADALQYAHEQGVVHRDVKPANILLSRGNPLVADFGIALAVSQAGGGRITETGLSLGTPHYMSPEQASGERTVDRRSDVYSLGCVLYEMLTGEPPHGGPTSQAVLARILTTRPQRVSELRRTVPPHVDAAVAKALEKLPADRFPSAGTFRDALQEQGFRHAITPAVQTGGTAPGTASRSRARTGRNAWIALTGALVLLAAWGWLRGASDGSEGRPARLSLDLAGLESVEGDVAISPDGARLAVSAELDGRRSIWIRRMDEADFRRMQDTEDGVFPVFSPDGEWLLFRRGRDETLVRVPVSGGGAITVLDDQTIDPYLPHWGDGGRIVFTGPQGVHVVSETGSGLRPVLSGLQAFSPQLLPGARTLVASTFSGPDVHFVDLDADTSWVVVSGARHPRYVATGHLLYVPESGGLFAVSFDPESGQATGAPSRVLDRVASRPIESRGYDVSADGTLVYREGTASAAAGPARRFVLLDRDGRADTLGLPAQALGDVRFSPDGGSIAYVTGLPEGHIYTFDLTTGRTTRLTLEGSNDAPIWSPDGTRIAFSSFLGSEGDELQVVPADGGEEPVPLLSLPGLVPGSWPTPDVIGYHHVSPGEGNVDLGTIAPTGDAEPRPWLAAPWNEAALRISPDGRLAAYASQEHGRWQVVLRTFPDPGGSWEIGERGVTTYGHRWSSDGRFLYYWTVPGDAPGPDPGILYRVEITGDPPDIRVGEPERILEADVLGSVFWDVHPDGERFVMTVGTGAVAAGEDEARPNERYLVVLDWFTELRERTGRGETR